MESDFVTWINDQLDRRGWTYAELSRRAQLSDSTISLVISEQRQPGLQFCIKVAGAFGLPVERVLRLAGHLPLERNPLSESQRLQRILELYNRLNPEDQELAIAFVERLANSVLLGRGPVRRRVPETEGTP